MSTEPSSRSPFAFILQQLEAAEEAAKQAAIEPPKRPRGRPPKVEEPPLLPGAYRHILSDEDSELDKQLFKEESSPHPTQKAKTTVSPPLTDDPCEGTIAIIIPHAEKYACVYEGKIIGTSKHKDYWEYHYARGDLRSIPNRVGKFARITASGSIESIASAKRLKERGLKGASIPHSMLSTEEVALLSAAVVISQSSAHG